MRIRISAGDPVRIAIARMRARWEAARLSRLDVPAIEEMLRAAFPGRATKVLPVAGYPGAVRLFVAERSGGWRSMYAFAPQHVTAFAAGARRV